MFLCKPHSQSDPAWVIIMLARRDHGIKIKPLPMFREGLDIIQIKTSVKLAVTRITRMMQRAV